MNLRQVGFARHVGRKCELLKEDKSRSGPGSSHNSLLRFEVDFPMKCGRSIKSVCFTQRSESEFPSKASSA